MVEDSGGRGAPAGRGCLAILFSFLGARPEAEAVKRPLGELFERRSSLLTAASLSFLGVLRAALPDGYFIASEVSLANLFSVKRNGGRAAFNRINQKRVDFVVCDGASLRPLCGIELDDASHEREERRSRDEFVEQLFQATGLPLLRFRAARSYNVVEVKARLASVLPNVGGTNAAP